MNNLLGKFFVAYWKSRSNECYEFYSFWDGESWFLGYDVTKLPWPCFRRIMFITSFSECFANKSKLLKNRRNKFLLLLLFGFGEPKNLRTLTLTL